MIFFEDLVPGERVEYGTCIVDREEMIEFARRYDPQPFHLSDEEAAASHFGRVSASGWFTCASAMGLIARYYIKNGLKGLGSPGLEKLRWLHPVYAGDSLTVSALSTDKRVSKTKPDMGIVATKTTVINQDGVIVLDFNGILMIARRGDGE